MAAVFDIRTEGRLPLALIGGLAGLAAWAFDDILSEVITDRRHLAVLVLFVMGGFGALLALIGPLRVGRAAVAGFALSAVAALGLWAWLGRFPDGATRIEPGFALVAIAVLFVIGLPFLAAGLQAPGGWRDYARLFTLSWGIVVRYAAALLFVALFWAVVFLSDALLRIVGIEVLERLFDEALPRAVLSGLVFGLALAVVLELSDALSPDLLLRLMRLLLPVLLLVSVVFLLALPLRGLSEAFGSLSAAATLLAVTIAALTLITAAVDASDAEAAPDGIPAAAARIMALILPVMAGVAVYAIWLRVGQYGWTPPRLAAALAGALLCVYGLAYAVSVLMGQGWRRRVRTTNIAMALASLVLALAWLSPVLNAQRISATSQVARFAEGRLPLDDLPLHELAHRWGYPGLAALDRLEAMTGHPDHGVLADRIAAARENDRRVPPVETADRRATRIARLAASLQVRPAGTTLPEGYLEGISDYHLGQWEAGCSRVIGDSDQGCTLIFHQMNPLAGSGQAIFLMPLADGQVEIGFAQRSPTGLMVNAGLRDVATGLRVRMLLPGQATALLERAPGFAPVTLEALQLNDLQLIPDN